MVRKDLVGECSFIVRSSSVKLISFISYLKICNEWILGITELIVVVIHYEWSNTELINLWIIRESHSCTIRPHNRTENSTPERTHSHISMSFENPIHLSISIHHRNTAHNRKNAYQYVYLQNPYIHSRFHSSDPICCPNGHTIAGEFNLLHWIRTNDTADWRARWRAYSFRYLCTD